jgi:hypothetical protein
MMAGHIIRMEEVRFPNNILYGKFHSTLSVGKPRTSSEPRNTRSEEKRRILREARAQKRL